ncbi:hypothetical protein PCIT_a3368 [Pseudoalteromonas citrea]|uniref:Porin n=2 Tax=Pseudoalteromonas citrea TaxID=43655 RepID=A0AAD4AGV5_9GAMM|nr:hypothetical protein [Pseudoalteromonas citrea]KAF7768853.1 hypothetical protein PCIT_a3368 [Pseudoalteromonas citrea]
MKLMILMLMGVWSTFTCYANVDIRGTANFSQRLYTDAQPEHHENQSLIFIESEFYVPINTNWSMLAKPYARYDSLEAARHQLDFKELNVSYVKGNFDAKVGVSEVFWGVTESRHLVDIVNQTDVLSSIDGEDKLGQPMVQLNWLHNSGAIQMFVMPYFRERNFASKVQRLHPDIVISSESKYEDTQESSHTDFAFRATNSIDNWELAVSYFNGTNRTPTMIQEADHYTPYYSQLLQYGFEIQGVFGAWLIKNEIIYRKGQFDWAIAHTSGFEYTHAGVLGDIDLGYLFEYSFDDLDEQSPSSFQNDLFFGMRVVINDIAGSEFLIGAVTDIDTHHWTMFRVEGSTRITPALRLKGELWVGDETRPNDPFYSVKQDDFLQLSIEYYF